MAAIEGEDGPLSPIGERQHVFIGDCPSSPAGILRGENIVAEATKLLITTNLPFEAWTEVLGSERLNGALLDHLTHRIHILEANGDSYRLRESKRRLGAPSRPDDERETA